ncbi:hypothetical protein [Cohnella faecalis]|nr:hypothetical protein [Cohnella faecalis]
MSVGSGESSKISWFYPVCATIERARAAGANWLREVRASVGSAVSVSRQCGSRSAGAPASGSVAGGGFFGLNGLDDWMGFMQKALPMVRMGVDMVKTIMPLLGGLKA